MSTQAWYGWRPDLPDRRDHIAVPKKLRAFPQSVSLVKDFPPCYDQGALGSCTANAIAGVLQYNELKAGHTKHSKDTPSRLFIYYNERDMEGSIPYDAGAYIRDGIKSVNRLGAPKEPLWPYKIAKFAKRPTKDSYQHAMARQTLEYARLDNTRLNDLLSTLASGQPFVFGFTVYENFESGAFQDDWVLDVPRSFEGVLGGHAVVAVGYDLKAKLFLVRNSWGTDWGICGNFWMTFDYMVDENLCDDFWVISKVE